MSLRDKPMSAADDARDARASTSSRVRLGAVKALFGTRGWIKLHSETRPREGIFDYSRWLIGARDDWHEHAVAEWRVQGSALIAKLDAINDRDAAAALIGREIAIDAGALPPAPAGSYYWRDLIGLEVVNRDGVALGVVKSLLETGSSDVLRVRGERERLIPFVQGLYVLDVDAKARRIIVDWQPDD